MDVKIEGDSVEAVAYALLKIVADVEQKKLFFTDSRSTEVASREWVLDAYAECLQAAKGRRDV